MYTGADYINSIPENYFSDYLKRVEAHVENKKGNLHAAKSTEWSRLILPLTAMGYDIRSVAGYDFIEKLSDSFSFSYRQGINGPIWEIISMNSGGYEFDQTDHPETANTFGKMLDYILNLEITDANGIKGGWALSGNVPDADITGMTLTAFAPYYLSQEKYEQTDATYSYDEFASAVEHGILVLANMQKPNGGFESWGTVNSESTGMSAAAVISPMLITFLGMDPYQAVGIALASDVLASAVSAYTYGKNKNLDVANGIVMMVTVLLFTLLGSYIASLLPSTTMGGFSMVMTLLLGVKFIVKPVMTTKEAMQAVSKKKRFIQSVICGMLIGFICGFVGAGGGLMMLLILTSVLGYELKTAVGTSVFIMAFTAFTGAASHFAIGGMPDITCLVLCVLFTFLWARIAARFANRAKPETLNRATGVVLVILGIVLIAFKML